MRAYAAVIDEKGGRFRFQDLQIDDPRPNEVLVRVFACGICQTELHVRDQDYPVPVPLVLGHEGAGVEEAVGSGVTTSSRKAASSRAARAARGGLAVLDDFLEYKHIALSPGLVGARSPRA